MECSYNASSCVMSPGSFISRNYCCGIYWPLKLQYCERVIFIGQHIDEEFSNQILATMLYLDSVDDSRKLFFYIKGPGGDLTPSMAIYDTMQSLKSPIGTVWALHIIWQPFFLLLEKRVIAMHAMPLSRTALQSPAGSARGQADDIRNEADELLRVRDYLFKELAEKTGQPINKIYKDLDRMKRFNAQEALEYGLIDRVVRPSRIKSRCPTKGFYRRSWLIYLLIVITNCWYALCAHLSKCCSNILAHHNV